MSNKHLKVLGTLWSLTLLSLVVRFHLVILIDNVGGLFAIGLKRTPSEQYRRFVSTEDFTAEGNCVLATGDDHGVEGYDLLKWHAEFGCWFICCTTLLGTFAVWRSGSSPRTR